MLKMNVENTKKIKSLRLLLEETWQERKRQRKGIFKKEVELNLGG